MGPEAAPAVVATLTTEKVSVSRWSDTSNGHVSTRGSRSATARARTSLLGSVASVLIVVSLGAPAGASSRPVAAPNPFCQAMIAVHPQPPTGVDYAAYRSFAKRYLAYYEKLDVRAPNVSVRRLLNQVIAIMKVEAATKNSTKLAAYVAAQQVVWFRDWTLFTKSIVSCGAWVVNLL